MYSIVIIIPYFGPLPDYFQLWLNSCRYNNTIDWLFFTDQDISGYDIPNNVIIRQSTLKELKSRFQEYFDFPISLEKPYKLCDYKPSYGEMFQDHIKDYDFWGYSDIDLIYGNIRKFLTEEILRDNERMFVSGHLSIYKNSQKMRCLYREITDNNLYYKEAFSSPFSYAFDEFGYKNLGGMFQMCYDLNINLHNVVVYSHIYEKPFKLKCDFGGSADEIKKEQSKTKVYFEYNKGKLTQHWNNNNEGKEICYLHIRLRKMKNQCSNTDHFYVYPGIYTDRKKKFFNTFGINPLYIKWRIKHLLFYVKNPDYVKWRVSIIVKGIKSFLKKSMFNK